MAGYSESKLFEGISMRTTLRTAGILVGLLVAFGGPAAAETLTVFAAASLKDALDETSGHTSVGTGDKIVVPMQRAPLSRSRSSQGRPPIFHFRPTSIGWTTSSGAAWSRSTPGGTCSENRLVLIAPADSRIS